MLTLNLTLTLTLTHVQLVPARAAQGACAGRHGPRRRQARAELREGADDARAGGAAVRAVAHDQPRAGLQPLGAVAELEDHARDAAQIAAALAARRLAAPGRPRRARSRRPRARRVQGSAPGRRARDAHRRAGGAGGRRARSMRAWTLVRVAARARRLGALAQGGGARGRLRRGAQQRGRGGDGAREVAAVYDAAAAAARPRRRQLLHAHDARRLAHAAAVHHRCVLDPAACAQPPVTG